QPSNAYEAAARRREQPAVLALLLGIARCGELVESVGDDQAASGGKLAAVRAEIVYRLAALSGPAPPPHDKIEAAVVRAHDRGRIGNPDVGRLEVRCALRKAEVDLLLAEQPGDFVGRFRLGVEVAHGQLAPCQKSWPQRNYARWGPLVTRLEGYCLSPGAAGKRGKPRQCRHLCLIRGVWRLNTACSLCSGKTLLFQSLSRLMRQADQQPS